MSRWSRIRDSVGISHDWPRRIAQGQRHGETWREMLGDVPGIGGISGQTLSFLRNDRFWDTFNWAIPRVWGGILGSTVPGMTGVGSGLGGMLGDSLQNWASDDPSSGPISTPSQGGSSLSDMLAMSRQGGQGGMAGQGGGPDRPYIGGTGLI